MRPCYGPLFPARARNKGTVTWAQAARAEGSGQSNVVGLQHTVIANSRASPVKQGVAAHFHI